MFMYGNIASTSLVMFPFGNIVTKKPDLFLDGKISIGCVIRAGYSKY